MRDLYFDIRARDRTQRAFDQARGNARRFNREVDRTTMGMRAASTAARAFAAAFTVTAVTGFGRALRDVVRDTAALSDEAARAGLSLQAFQEWKAVAEDTRIPIDSIVDAFKELNIRADEFAETAKGSAAEAFARLGMSPEEVQRRIKDPSEFMLELIQRTRMLNDTAAATRIFDELFGGTGAEQAIRLLQLSNGEIRNIITSAHEAGRVFDDQLVAKADKLDREFATMWRNFETNAKAAAINTLTALRPLDDWARELIESHPLFSLGDALLGDSGTEIDAVTSKLESLRRELDLLEERKDLNIELAMPTDEVEANIQSVRQQIAALQAQLANLNAEAQRSYVVGTPGDPNALARATPGRKKTVIPNDEDDEDSGSGGGGGRGGGGGGISIDRYQQVIDRLEHEKRLLGETALQQKILNAQRQAGVEAASAQGQVIAQKITAIESEREALKRLEDQQRAVNEAGQFMGGMLLDSLFSVAEGAMSAEDALRRMVSELARAVAYGALLGQGPLGGLLGGASGGGLIGSIFGGLFGGGLAEGGAAQPWKEYMVGERGPEKLIMGAQGGRVVPSGEGSGSGQRQITIHLVGEEGALFTPRVREISGHTAEVVVKEAAPQIVGNAVRRANDSVIPVIARYQRDAAGGDYRG